MHSIQYEVTNKPSRICKNNKETLQLKTHHFFNCRWQYIYLSFGQRITLNVVQLAYKNGTIQLKINIIKSKKQQYSDLTLGFKLAYIANYS